MKKKIQFLLLAIVIIAAMIVPAFAYGADGEAQVQITAKMDFPLTLTFNISAQSNTQITDMRLHYTVDRTKNAYVISEEVVAFTPSTQVTAMHVMDMRQSGGMPPGSSMTYWLTVKDSTGKETDTLPQKIEINDDRYGWRTLQQGLITLYWYQGNDNFAQQLMDAAQQALGRLSENTGAELKDSVKLYIYANTSDLQGSMIFSQDWTGGVAFTEYNIIAIGIGTSASELEWGKSTISHELTHLVVHQATDNPYNGIPPWLDEGLAMYSEGPLGTQFTSALEQAEANNSFISVRSLSSPFSAYADTAVLAYAESYEIVNYLIDQYGREKMLQLLTTFQKGSGYDAALQSVYGFDMTKLNTLWQTTPAAAGTP